jgi:hypothetical protein
MKKGHIIMIVFFLLIVFLSCKNKSINNPQTLLEESINNVNFDIKENDNYSLYNNGIPYYRNGNEVYCALFGFDYKDEKDNEYYRSIIENNICKIHNIEMEKQNINLLTGILKLNNMEEELNILRREYFPNTNDPISTYDVIYSNEEGWIKNVKFYVCDECNKERDKYKNLLDL